MTYNQGGCSVESNHMFVEVIEIPETPIISSNSPINIGDDLYLFSNYYPNTIYTWSGPNGFVSNLQNPIIENINQANGGVYSLILTKNGCNSSPEYISVIILEQIISGDTILVSGSIVSENGYSIPNVNLIINSLDEAIISDGYYNISLLENYSYTLSPEKNSNDCLNESNGNAQDCLTTLDLFMIQSHIVGNNNFTSPFDIIAADANQSSSISTFDILYIQQIVLAEVDAFPLSNLWKFINSDFIFPDPEYPFDFDDYRLISSNIDLINQDFIGVKIGDVSGSWESNQGGRESQKEVLLFNYNQIDKNTKSIPVYSDNFNDIISCQFTIDFNYEDISIIDIRSNYNINWNDDYLLNGYLPVLFFDENGSSTSINNDTPIFIIDVEVNKSTSLGLSSNITTEEAVNENYEFLSLDIKENMILDNELIIYPNPFTDFTTIEFINPNGDEFVLKLFSIDGKLINTLISKKNKFIVDKNNLAKGMYHIKLIGNSSIKNATIILN